MNTDRIIDFDLIEKVITSERNIHIETVRVLETLEEDVGEKRIDEVVDKLLSLYKEHMPLVTLLQTQMYAPELNTTEMN